MSIEGKRIAIFGLGRSGLAIGKAALQLGAIPHVVDEKAATALPKPEILDEAAALGLPVTTGWAGSFEATDLLVTNPAVDMRHPKLQSAVAAGIEVISEVEFAFRIAKAPIVAITGTNGKSTTTVMTYLCLRACGEDAILCGNIFGSGYEEMPMTEAALSARPDQVLVAEISSFQLEWVRDFRPVSAGITNITPDHQDRYDSFEQYAATKQRIFAAQGRSDFAVVRANDPVVVAPGQSGTAYVPRHLRGRAAAATGGGPEVLKFGASAQEANVDELGLQLFGKRIRIDDLPFKEPHNLQNAAMASLLAYGLLRHRARTEPGGSAAQILSRAAERPKPSVFAARSTERDERAMPDEVIAGLKNFRGLAHRMEFVGERGGVRVINNSMCTNPDAVVKSVQAVRDPSHILIGGVNKDLDFAPLRNYLANGRHRAYLFGRDAQAINQALGGAYPVFDRMQDAFEKAVHNAKSGEVVILAPGCASTDQFADFRDRGNVFRTIAKEWLRS